MGYFKYNDQSISCYEFNPITSKWAIKSTYSANLCTDKCTYGSRSFKSNILYNVEDIYYDSANNQYHLFVNTKIEELGLFSIGEIITDQNFNFNRYEITAISTSRVNFYAINLQGNTIRVIYQKPNVITNGHPSTESFNFVGYYKVLPGGDTVMYDNTNYSIISPTVATLIGRNLLVNSSSQQNQFDLYNLTDKQITKVSLMAKNTYNSDIIWSQLNLNSVNFITVNRDDSTCLLNRNLNLYSIKIINNQPVFSNVYSNWFPGNSSVAISQGVLYQQKLFFLVNNFELWSFDQDHLTIDFSQPGVVTRIPL